MLKDGTKFKENGNWVKREAELTLKKDFTNYSNNKILVMRAIVHLNQPNLKGNLIKKIK